MLYKGSTSVNPAFNGRKFRAIYLGDTLVSGPGSSDIVAVYPQEYWNEQNVLPIARWINAPGDTVEGNSYDVHVVAFTSTPGSDVDRVEFFIDGSPLQTVSSRSSLACPNTGDSVGVFSCTINTSSWNAGDEHEITARVYPEYGAMLELSGELNAEVVHPRAEYVASYDYEEGGTWSINSSRTGIHSLYLYKAQAETSSTLANLQATIQGLANEAGHIVVVSDSGNISSEFWADSSAALRTATANGYLTIRGAGDGITIGRSTPASPVNATIPIKYENISFDATIQVGTGRKTFFKNCDSARGLRPFVESDENLPEDATPADPADFPSGTQYYYYQATDQILVNRIDVGGTGQDQALSYTSIIKGGNKAAGTYYHSCTFSNFDTLYKVGMQCFDCIADYAFRDTFANIPSVVACQSWNMPYGRDPINNTQFHNDILQNASNMINAMFYSISSYQRLQADGDVIDDDFGNQGQFFSFRDLSNRDTTWNGFVLKDCLMIGTRSDSQPQFALGVYNGLIENVTILQKRAAAGVLGDGINWHLEDDVVWNDDTPREGTNQFVKYRWGHLLSGVLPVPVNLSGVDLYADPAPMTMDDPDYIRNVKPESFFTLNNVVFARPAFPALNSSTGVNGSGGGLDETEYTFDGTTQNWDEWHSDARLFSAYADAIGSTMTFVNVYFVGGTRQAGADFPSAILPNGVSLTVPNSSTAGAPDRLNGPTRDSAWFESYIGIES